MSVATSLSTCNGGVQRLTYTSEYPLDWSRAEYHYDASDNVVLIEFFVGEILQFRHIMEYDTEGNLTSKTIE